MMIFVVSNIVENGKHIGAFAFDVPIASLASLYAAEIKTQRGIARRNSYAEPEPMSQLGPVL